MFPANTLCPTHTESLSLHEHTELSFFSRFLHMLFPLPITLFPFLFSFFLGFSNFNVQTIHPGILSKGRFWVRPGIPQSSHVPRWS